MSQTRQQIARQQMEGSMRRKFDYLVTRLSEAEVRYLSSHWSIIEDAIGEVRKKAK